MPAELIDGKAVAARLRATVAAGVAALDFQPGLAVVVAGSDPASAVYVRNKDRAARAAGIAVQTRSLPAEVSEAELLAVIDELNDDPAVDGILVQLPLPRGLSRHLVINRIDPAKDVDGLHPLNAGRLSLGLPASVPCTPLGVMKLLDSAGIVLSGLRVMVLGRSDLVGKPLASLMTAADATVTLAHSRTRNLEAECRRAEVLVAAVGRAELVRGNWIADQAVVIDVGINRLADGRLTGDVAFEEAFAHARAITPVPGGVGPMTIACLLENTVTAALRRR